MQIIGPHPGPHPRHNRSGILGTEPRNLCINVLSKSLWCMLKFKNHFPLLILKGSTCFRDNIHEQQKQKRYLGKMQGVQPIILKPKTVQN